MNIPRIAWREEPGPKGYYWRDEYGWWNGPYDSPEQAEADMDAYDLSIEIDADYDD